ncbi:MAG TPA: alpha/beta hydrolase [Pseudonocardiaceae bacterium]|jgi:pimeloyl-ACP methyl ester carboxylesterase|nr:alpha/beta hydrolase [Pseudonocardiaceae bacterium]
MTSTATVRSFPTTDGTRLALHWQGNPQAALTLVLAHGWTLDSRVWGPVVDLLAPSLDVRVLRYDHRGHGRSDPAPPGTTTIAQLADDLADLLCGVVSGPVVLAGHSMGGMAIMALAERYPDLVAQRVVGAVFVATSGGQLMPLDFGLQPLLGRLLARGEARLLRAESIALRLRGREWTIRRAGLVRPGVRWLLFGEHPRRADIDLTARCMAQGRPGNIVDFRPTFDDHDRAAALTAFAHVPTLVLAGTRDRLIPVRHAAAIAAALPDATLVRYAGAGHMVLLERAEQVATRISELVSRVLTARMGPARPGGDAAHGTGVSAAGWR